MANLNRGQTFGATETVTNTKLHNLVDLGSVTDIVNNDISASADIADTKIVDITTGGKVRGTSILNLPSIPSGAGRIPDVNVPNTYASLVSMSNVHISGGFISVPDLAVTSLASISSLALASGPSINAVYDEDDMVSDSATGIATQQSIKAYADTKMTVEVFTASDTWTVPAGITKVFVTAVGGGGGGAGAVSNSRAAGGGGGGESIIMFPYTVTPSASLTVTVGSGGAGGSAGDNNGSDGTASVFDNLTIDYGRGGSSSGGGGAGGSGGQTGTSYDPSPADVAKAYTTFGPASFKGGDGGTGPSNDKSGAGGSTVLGTGGNGVSGAPNNGEDGTGHGSGGSGGGGGAGQAKPGGAGQDGIVIISY